LILCLRFTATYIQYIQILVQIQQTAVQSQRALNLSRQQIVAKDRERRIVQLTIDEISHMQGDVNLYKGIGKMSVVSSCRNIMTHAKHAKGS
jgi:Tfp pilus assembly protein PilN